VTETGQMPSVGKRLAVAREAAGLTVEEVAESLKLLPRQITAIENDDHASLPGTVFVRGFIRNYARLVKLDADALVAEGAPTLRNDSALAAPSEDIVMPMGRGRKTLLIAAAGIAAVLVVVVLVYFWLRGDSNILGPLPMSTTESAQVRMPAPTSAQEIPPEAPGDAPESDESTADPAVAATEKTLPESESDTAEQLVFRFDRDSWVRISDAYGEIARELVSAGSERRFTGKPPFSLVIGNAKYVHLTYGGKPVDLAAHTQVSVARLTLE
jgi:cytoskeleton protein RodZ